MQKGFAPIIIIFSVMSVLIGIGVGGYIIASIPKGSTYSSPLSAPTTSPLDETTNWKTYTNTKYLYSVKYPGNWSSHESGIVGYFLPPDVADNQNFQIAQGKAISIFVRNIKTPINLIYIEYRTVKKLIVAGVEVEVKQQGDNAYGRFAEIGRGDDIFTIQFGGNLDLKYNSVFEKIVTSFVFLPLTSAEKTCIDSEGRWLNKYNECESVASDKGINEGTCKSAGGIFKECDSVCRHIPNAENCIDVCVKVCKFN